uniref:GLPGLI family protein n=1 Tax=Flavobacterium sp. TaxID=239 RepID=UPI004049727B
MKLNRILLWILNFNCLILFAQNNIEVDYEILFNRTTFDEVPNQSAEFVKMKNMILSAENYLYFKLISNGTSYTFFREPLNLDSDDKLLEAVISSINPDHYFGDFKTGKIFVSKSFNYEDYIIPLNKLNWEILQETKTIEGFVCYKAIAIDNQKKEISVWFTPKIPHNVGPNEAIGLPGLVLELNYTKYNLVAKKILFEIDLKQFDKKTNPKGISISEEDFQKLVAKIRQNLN